MKLRYALLFILITACTSKSPVTSVTVPKIVNEQQALQLYNGVITGEGETRANGIAEFIYNLTANTSLLKISLNIEPKDAINYQVWLKNPTNNEWLSAGALRNPNNNARFTSSAELPMDARMFTEVLVTEQPVGTESRDNIVAKATLKPVVLPGI